MSSAFDAAATLSDDFDHRRPLRSTRRPRTSLPLRSFLRTLGTPEAKKVYAKPGSR
jgi:hypothetical protein